MRLNKRLFGSISIRLSIQLSLLFILFAAACAALIAYQLSNIEETARSLRLQRQFQEIRQALRLDDRGIPTYELHPELMPRYLGEEPTSFYALRNAAGDLVVVSSKALLDSRGADFFRGLRRGESNTAAKDGLDKAFYFLSEPVKASDHEELLLIVGKRTSTTDALLHDVEWRLLAEIGLAAIPISLAVFGASLMIIRSGLAPIGRLSEQADRIGPANPAARIEEADLPAELRGLAEAANAAASRLQEAIASQRGFTADTAHQLLTLLELLSARIDHSSVQNPDPGVRADIGRMQNLVRQLLNLSRLASVREP